MDGAGFLHQVLYLRFIQLGILVEQARLPEATALARELQTQAEQAAGPGGDLAAVAELLLAHVLALQGDAASAAELLERALPQVMDQDAWFDIQWAGHAAAVGVAVLGGDEPAAMAVLDRGLALAERRRLHRLGARLQVHRIELLLPREQAAHAIDLAEALDLTALHARFDRVDRRVADAAWLTAWRVHCARPDGPARRAEAVDALAARIETWAAEGSALQAIEALLLLAQVERQRDNAAACARSLDRALSMAVPGHVLLPFVEHGLPLADDFEQALTRSGGRGAPNLRSRFLATVLDSVRRQAGSPVARHPQGLSPREAQIGALLRQGLSNKLIGRELGLSEGTVKFHLRNLYDKLGAHTREDAVRLLAAPPRPA